MTVLQKGVRNDGATGADVQMVHIRSVRRTHGRATQRMLRAACACAVSMAALAATSCGGGGDKGGSGTIVEPPAGGTVASVSVTLSDAAIQLGGLAQANVGARDANNAVIAVGSRPLAWTSSNPSIATVTSSGTISAVGVGTTQISAAVTEGSKQVVGSATLSVTNIPGAPLTADVSMPGLTFSPADIVVKVNGTVRFIFPALEHNVFWQPKAAGAPDDINTTSSKTVSRTFTTPGVYPFVCTLHNGMTGTVVVTP